MNQGTVGSYDLFEFPETTADEGQQEKEFWGSGDEQPLAKVKQEAQRLKQLRAESLHSLDRGVEETYPTDTGKEKNFNPFQPYQVKENCNLRDINRETIRELISTCPLLRLDINIAFGLIIWSCAKMCSAQLRVALVSLVSVIGFFSGCGTPYGTMGGFSEVQLASDICRVSFSPYGYTSWDFAYQAGLLRCATLTIHNGYRYFGVLAIENYGSVNSFNLPRNGYTYGAGKAHGFYNTTTAYNPPPSFSILWPIPALTIALLRNPIPGVTLDAGAIRNRGMTEIR